MVGRTWFFLVMLVAGLAAVAFAVRGSRLPPADFTFFNESEIKSVDPALINGEPEGRIASLFEGLTRPRAQDMLAEPGVAERWEISDDGRVYTFHLRENARWSNGDPVTSRDFLYSIRRLLDPLTFAEYSYQAWYIVNAKRYSYGAKGIAPGDAVEVELNRPPTASNLTRGKVLLGELVRVEGPEITSDESNRDRVFVVRIDGRERRFKTAEPGDHLPDGVEACRQVLLDFREVAVRATDDRTLEIRLINPTPYFLELLSFYPFAPVHQGCLERYGAPDWKRPENIVNNGAFCMAERRIRDRIRLVKSQNYWDRENVRLNVIDALSIEDRNTGLNIFLSGTCDWTTQPPPNAIRQLLAQRPPRNDINPYPQLTTYFYLLNTTRPPLNDVRIRRALSMALDREEITRVATAAGETPAYSFVPPHLPGYTQQPSAPRNPEKARQLMAEAGYPGGVGCPKLEIHYNSDQVHQSVAELARKQWQRELGITVSLRNEEWASAQQTQQQMDYMISRRSWIGDYLDPNTFLDMFLTNGQNNLTGFSNAKYEQLIADAAKEPDKEKRMRLLEQAERILMDEMPIIPIYYYVSRNLVKAYVRGWYNNLQDHHPLRAIWIDHSADLNSPQPNEFMGRVP